MEMYKKIKSIADDGYSLVELVAAMGLLMLLTSVVGVASYNTINSKQTREAVRLATQAAYNEALSSITDFDDATTPKESLIKSNKEAEVEGISFTYAPNDVLPTKDSLCVEGSIKGDIKGEFNYKIGPETCENAELQPLPDAEDQTLPDYVVSNDITRILYTCDGLGTRDARLNIANLVSGTKATLMGKDGSIIPVSFSASSANGSSIKYRDNKASPVVSNVSNTFKIKNGVEYELIVEGKFANIGTLSHSSGGTALDMTGCMTDIVQLGNDNGVKEISSFEAKKFSKFSAASIPASVTSLRYMFDSAPINDASVSAFNTKNVVDMKGVFNGANLFNQSLANWETAKVTDMASMFENASKFNQKLTTNGNKWNTSKVEDMSSMFKEASSYNQSMSNWRTDRTSNMASMFEGATLFNNGCNSSCNSTTNRLSFSNTSNVENMSKMFKDATNFNSSLRAELSGGNSLWNVSNVKDMSFMFYNATSYNQNMETWNSTQVTNFESMFHNAKSFNGMVGKFKTDNADSYKNMFNGATSFNQSFNRNRSIGWNSAKVVDAQGMFQNATSFNSGNAKGTGRENKTSIGPVEKFEFELDTTKMTNTSYMFAGATSFNAQMYMDLRETSTTKSMFEGATDFNNGFVKGALPTYSFMIDGRQIKDSSYMFADATSFNSRISDFRLDAVSNAESMFEGATDFNNGFSKGEGGPDSENWILMKWESDVVAGTTRRIDVSKMFKGAVSFNSNFAPTGDTTKWNRVTNTSSMFEGATSFNGNLGQISSMGNVNNMSNMFKGATSFNQDLTNLNATNSLNMASMFDGAKKFNNGGAAGTRTKPIAWNTAKVTDMSYMFAHTPFNQDLNGSMAKVKTTQGMFYNSSSYNATIKGMENAPNLETTLAMFLQASSFNSSTVGKWRMPNVTNMERMFRQATSFNGDLRGWEVSNVTNMNQMFAYASSFNNYLLGWDTRNVQDMSFMFAYATSYDQPLTSQHSWNTSSVTNMESMLEGASSFNNRGSANWAMDWNTARVTNMKAMFKGTTSFTKHALNFNTANVTDMSYMFEGSNFNNGITSNIGTAPISWNTGKVTDMSYMFARANYNQNFTGSMANVTTTKGMFQYNTWVFADFTGLREANKITDMSYMFQGASRYNLRTSPQFYTNNVTRFEHMWDGATAFNQDLSGWNVGKMTHYYNFGRNSGLTAAKLPKGFVASSAGL